MGTEAGRAGNAPERRSAGALSTKRRPLRWPQDQDFRVLSLDGGGIKGLYTAAVLAHLEQVCLGGRPIGAYFDLIAGTSTGGIIALALATGRSAAEVLDLYLEHGQAIFPRRKIVGVFRPAFRAEKLAELLGVALGDHIIGDARTRLCIPSCEGKFGDVNVFKTPHHPDFKMDWKVPMREAALATSAAPTFLPVHLFGDYIYVDGGIWANNPAMVAVVDAVTAYNVPPQNIRMLSIGTGARAPTLRRRHLSWGGLVSWMMDGTLIESFMHYSGLNAQGQAWLMIGRDRMVRLEPEGEDAAVHLTDYAAARGRLVPAGRHAAEAHQALIVQALLHSPAQPPTFFHGPQATLVSPNWAA